VQFQWSTSQYVVQGGILGICVTSDNQEFSFFFSTSSCTGYAETNDPCFCLPAVVCYFPHLGSSCRHSIEWLALL
jgi:hypothetical protein